MTLLLHLSDGTGIEVDDTPASIRDDIGQGPGLKRYTVLDDTLAPGNGWVNPAQIVRVSELVTE